MVVFFNCPVTIFYDNIHFLVYIYKQMGYYLDIFII